MDSRLDTLDRTLMTHGEDIADLRGSIQRVEGIMNHVLQQLERLQKDPSDTKSKGNTESEVVFEPHFWTKKVELPVFDGTDPLSWIARAEIFFEVHQVKEEEKIRLAFISMEGEAVHWYRFIRNFGGSNP